MIGQDAVRVGAGCRGVGVDERGGQPGIACSRACSALTVTSCAWAAVMSGLTTISHSARIWWPIQRSRTCPTPSTPGVSRRVLSAWPVSAGSTVSISRW